MNVCKIGLVALMCVNALCAAQKLPIIADDDKEPSAVLKEVAQTRQDILDDMAGIKKPKPKHPRAGIYGAFNLAPVSIKELGVASMLGFEVGYDFIFNEVHSLRLFGFFDRVNYGSFGDFIFDVNRANNLQIYRGGISAEYRLHANEYIGFRIRLGSLGSFSLNQTNNPSTSTSLNLAPTLKSKSQKWYLPTIAIGAILTYTKHHELFIGYDLIDYDKDGFIANYVRYAYRF